MGIGGVVPKETTTRSGKKLRKTERDLQAKINSFNKKWLNKGDKQAAQVKREEPQILIRNE